MASHDYVIDNAPGGTVRADLNSAFAAIVSLNSGTSAPGTTYAYMLWADTTTGKLKQRNAANSAWIEILPAMASTYGGLAATVTTTRGDIIRRGAAADERHALGADKTIVASDGTDTLFRTRQALGLLIQGKHTIAVPAAAMTARTTNGAAAGSAEKTTNKNMFVTKDFDASTQEFVQFFIPMPKSWNLGTVTFIPVWSHAAAVTNFGVVWALQAVAISNDDAGDVAFGTEQTSTDTGGTTDDLYVGPESAAITVAGTPAAGDFVMFQLKRNVADGSDTLAVDARLHAILLLYTSNAQDDT